MQLIPTSLARRDRTKGVTPVGPNRLRIGTATAVLGLLWMPERADIPLADQAAIASGSGGDFDLYANYSRGRQIGFTSSHDLARPGMIAAATAFNSNRMGRAWLAAFRCGDPFGQWWIVAARDGRIFEDRICPEEPDAVETFHKMLEAPGWDRIVAPAGWGITSSIEGDISELVTLGAADRIRSISRRSMYILLGLAICAILAASALGWKAYKDFELARQWEEVEIEVMTMSQPVQAPWHDSPEIGDFLKACQLSMERLMLIPPGWELKSMSCVRSQQGGVVNASWSRRSGDAAFLEAMVGSLAGIPVEFGDGSLMAVARKPIAIVTDTVRPQMSWPPTKLESTLRERFRAVGLHIELRHRKGRTPPRTGGQHAFSRAPRFDLSISTLADLRDLASLLSGIPALVPEAVLFQPRSGSWKLTAKAYHSVI